MKYGLPGKVVLITGATAASRRWCASSRRPERPSLAQGFQPGSSKYFG